VVATEKDAPPESSVAEEVLGPAEEEEKAREPQKKSLKQLRSQGAKPVKLLDPTRRSFLKNVKIDPRY